MIEYELWIIEGKSGKRFRKVYFDFEIKSINLLVRTTITLKKKYIDIERRSVTNTQIRIHKY